MYWTRNRRITPHSPHKLNSQSHSRLSLPYLLTGMERVDADRVVAARADATRQLARVHHLRYGTYYSN